MRLDLLGEPAPLRDLAVSTLFALARQRLVPQHRPSQRLMIVVDHVVGLRRQLAHDAEHLPLRHVPERLRHLRHGRVIGLERHLGLRLAEVLVHAGLKLALFLTICLIFPELNSFLFETWLTLHLRSLPWNQSLLKFFNLFHV